MFKIELKYNDKIEYVICDSYDLTGNILRCNTVYKIARSFLTIEDINKIDPTITQQILNELSYKRWDYEYNFYECFEYIEYHNAVILSVAKSNDIFDDRDSCIKHAVNKIQIKYAEHFAKLKDACDKLEKQVDNIDVSGKYKKFNFDSCAIKTSNFTERELIMILKDKIKANKNTNSKYTLKFIFNGEIT